MAKTLLLQNLVDASADIETLGEFTNEDKVVVSRLGMSYPSAPMASRLILESGIIANATVFLNYGEMSGSLLEENAYGYVIDDAINVNGYYQKRSGQWVYLGVNFGRVPSSFPITANDKPINIVNTDVTGFNTAGGIYQEDNLYRNSKIIPVAKNECYVLTRLTPTSTNASVFTMVSEQGVFINSLSSASFGSNQNSPSIEKNIALYSNANSASTYAVIIPNDGFMVVTTWLNADDASGADDRPLLYKTDYMGFLAAAQIQAPPTTLIALKGILHSAKIDPQLINSGKNSFSYNRIGFPVAYEPSPDSAVSERYPVTAGQYIHIHSAPASSTTYRMVFEHENGSFQGSADIVTDHTLSFGGGGYVGINIKSTHTGYVRIASSTKNTTPFLVGFTDAPINLDINYLKHNQIIDFYENVSLLTPTSFNQIANIPTITDIAGNFASENGQYTCSIPYVLRKGDVLEYELAATNYQMLAIAFPYGVPSSDVTSAYEKGIALNAVEVISTEQNTAWANAGRPEGITPYALASKGKIAFCDEDRDSVIVFLRPNKKSSLYFDYKQSTAYKLSILTKDDYIAKRNSEISDRFSRVSGIEASPVNGYFGVGTYHYGTGSFPSVLMFKGEVLSYLTNHLGSGVVQKIGYTVGTGVPPVIVPDAGVAYHQFGSPDYLAPAITKSNKQSHRFSQVYCRETCIFTPSVLITSADRQNDLDAERLIADKYYPARIMQLKDIEVGVNIKPIFYSGTAILLVPEVVETNINPNGSEIEILTTRFFMGADSLVSFAAKGSYIECDSWITDTTVNPFLAPLKASTFNNLDFTAFTHKGDSDLNKFALVQAANYRYGFELLDDSVVVVPSATRLREVADIGNPADATNPIMAGTYNHELKNIKHSRAKDYVVTSETRVRIPETGGLTFNFCTANGVSLLDSVWGIMQIIQNTQVILTLNVKTENQGQSTADYARKNVNVEFFNDKFEKVYIQFADYIEEQEVVLKSYMYSDKAHYKDTLSANTWHSLRTAEAYPNGSVLPNSVFENLTYPANQKARGTPFGFPVELHRGGQFSSLATLRNKKKRENFGMQKGDKAQILMQADWKIKGIIDWSIVDLGYFEIRNPSISGYTNGDLTLPTGFESVQTASTRIIDWMRRCYNGSIDVRATYAEYINLNSFLDYALAIAITGNEDGVYNNFLLGTHDSTIWRAYWYDADGGWGGTFDGAVTAVNWMDNRNFFRKLATDMLPELKLRYAMHRRLGSINTKVIQTNMKNLSDSIHSDSKALDVKYWGAVPASSTLPSGMKWCAARIAYLDNLYGYAE